MLTIEPNVGVFNLVTYLNWTPCFEWDVCLKNIRLQAQIMISILGLILDMIFVLFNLGGRNICPFNEHMNLHSNNYEGSGYGLDLDFLDHLILIASFIS